LCDFQPSLLAIPLVSDPKAAPVFATFLLAVGALFAVVPVVSALRPVPQTDPFYV
jgi:hypothetical protein